MLFFFYKLFKHMYVLNIYWLSCCCCSW